MEGEWLRIDCRQNLEQAIEDFACDKARINNALKAKTTGCVLYLVLLWSNGNL